LHEISVQAKASIASIRNSFGNQRWPWSGWGSVIFGFERHSSGYGAAAASSAAFSGKC
jgi:hypothetical protein